MTPVLLDTGCIVALLDRSEKHHEQCSGVIAQLEAPLVTCEAVIAEACYLLRGMKEAPLTVLENVRQSIFHIPYRLVDHADIVGRLMKKYRNIPMDLADACLVTMAEKLHTGRILTLDSDFQVYRWGKNHPFDLLLKG